jgi:hypothetical protein
MFRKIGVALVAAAALASTALDPTSASAWDRGGGFRDGGFPRDWRDGRGARRQAADRADAGEDRRFAGRVSRFVSPTILPGDSAPPASLSAARSKRWASKNIGAAT